MAYFDFHNRLYETVWKSNRCRHDEPVETWSVLHTYPSGYKVIFVGDAAMSPYEITHSGGSVEHFNEESVMTWLERLGHIYPKLVWLNPTPDNIGTTWPPPTHSPPDHGPHASFDAARPRPRHARADASSRPGYERRKWDLRTVSPSE